MFASLFVAAVIVGFREPIGKIGEWVWDYMTNASVSQLSFDIKKNPRYKLAFDKELTNQYLQSRYNVSDGGDKPNYNMANGNYLVHYSRIHISDGDESSGNDEFDNANTDNSTYSDTGMSMYLNIISSTMYFIFNICSTFCKTFLSILRKSCQRGSNKRKKSKVNTISKNGTKFDNVNWIKRFKKERLHRKTGSIN